MSQEFVTAVYAGLCGLGAAFIGGVGWGVFLGVTWHDRMVEWASGGDASPFVWLCRGIADRLPLGVRAWIRRRNARGVEVLPVTAEAPVVERVA